MKQVIANSNREPGTKPSERAYTIHIAQYRPVQRVMIPQPQHPSWLLQRDRATIIKATKHTSLWMNSKHNKRGPSQGVCSFFVNLVNTWCKNEETIWYPMFIPHSALWLTIRHSPRYVYVLFNTPHRTPVLKCMKSVIFDLLKMCTCSLIPSKKMNNFTLKFRTTVTYARRYLLLLSQEPSPLGRKKYKLSTLLRL